MRCFLERSVWNHAANVQNAPNSKHRPNLRLAAEELAAAKLAVQEAIDEEDILGKTNFVIFPFNRIGIK